LSKNDRIRLEGREPVHLPEGVYEGIITRVERGPAPWPPRRVAEGKEERKDWHCYYVVELYRAVDSSGNHDQIEAWARMRQRRPEVLFPCRYTTKKNSTIPLPIKSTASNLHSLLMLTRPGASIFGTDLPFEQPVGWGVRVRCGKKLERDWTQDRDPIPEARRGLVVRKALAAFPAEYLKLAVSSVEQTAESKQRLYSMGNTPSHRLSANGSRTPVAGHTSSRRGIGECPVGQATAVEEGNPQKGLSSTAGEGLLAKFVPLQPLSQQDLAQRLKQRFGRSWQQVGRSGQCAGCGQRGYAREYEASWCPHCNR
jgi:hypothetical protein